MADIKKPTKKTTPTIRKELIGKTMSNRLTPTEFIVEDTKEFIKAAKFYKLDVFESK